MELSYAGLLVVGLVALGAPVLANVARRLHLPSPALEILLGIVVGPQVLDLVAADDVVVEVVSSLGLAFLLFLAGLELDLPSLGARRSPILRSYGLTLLLALPVAFGLHLLDSNDQTAFLAVALVATSLGLVVPILQDSGQITTTFGQTVMGNSSLAEFSSIVLLSLFFSQDGSTTESEIFLLVIFALMVLLLGGAMLRVGRRVAVSRTVLRLENTSAQLGIRLAMALLLVFVALSGDLGFETVLGAFVAGALLRVIDPEARLTHEQFMSKVQAIGYGFLVPAFFVATGVAFDLDALLDDPSSLALVPALLVGLLVVRGLPALVYRREMGARNAVAAGLLQATSLSFLIVAATVGTELGTIDSSTSAALVGGGLLSVVLFPPMALALLGRARGVGMPTRWRVPGLDHDEGLLAGGPGGEGSPTGTPGSGPALSIDLLDLRVVTCNVRFFNPLDGPDAWPERRDELLEVVRGLGPDVLGFQEAVGQQVEDLVERLPDHDWFGQGRNDGALGGELTPIFYRRRRFAPMDGGTFWLSDQPMEPGSRSWGASHPRIVTWLALADRWTGVEVVVANTHLDHASSTIRVHQAEVLLERLLPIVGDRPVVVVGDLNDDPGSDVLGVFGEVLRDAREVSATPPEGPRTSFNGFKGPKDGLLIDHVFVGGPVEVRGIRVVDEQGTDGRFLSDHYPVLASLRLQP